jgi:hypothetical protein
MKEPIGKAAMTRESGTDWERLCTKPDGAFAPFVTFQLAMDNTKR